MNPTLQKLKGKNQVKFVTKDSELGELEWVIKPIPFTLLLENFDKFEGLPEEKSALDLDSETAKKLQKQIYPLMRAIIPKCIVEPRISETEPVPDDCLFIDDIPFNSVVEIFNKVVEITGLDKAGEEARKKLQATQSVNQ
jgi:hypothetical protein